MPNSTPWQPHVLQSLKLSQVTLWFGLMEGLQEGVIIQDASTKVVAINEAACKLLQINRSSIIDHDSRDMEALKLVTANGTPYPPGEDPAYRTLVSGTGVASEFIGVNHLPTGPLWFIANFMPIWENIPNGGMADGVMISFHASPTNALAVDHRSLLKHIAPSSIPDIPKPVDVYAAPELRDEPTRPTSSQLGGIVQPPKVAPASSDLPEDVANVLNRTSERARAKLFEQTFNLSTAGNVLLHLDGAISAINPTLARLLGREEDKLVGMDWRTLVRPEDQHVVAQYIRTLTPNTPDAICIRLFHATGRAIQTLVLGYRIDSTDPNIPPQYYLTFEEIAGRFGASGMPSVETHDALTGLPNAAYIEERISQSLNMATRRQTKVALLHVDIDKFVRINNSLGHDVGDQLLVEVGKRIQSTIRSHDTAGRIRGDEFVVISEDVKETSDAMRLADRISKSMRQPFSIDGENLIISTSIGIAFAEANDVPSQLMRRADMAMHEAKETGRDTVSLYSANLQEKALERLNIENEIRVALPNGQMRLHHQPIIRLDTKEVVGTEALIRWQHPTRGLLSPFHFLPVAEESDLIVDVGKWVLEEASQQAYRYNASRGLHTAVNVSAKQLAEPGFVELVQATLERVKLPPEHLVLELTETSLLNASAKTFQDIETLTDFGIKLAIDDFGTGYSSLTYLDRLPVSVVKIDRSFVKEMVADGRRRAIAQAVISLGQALHLDVVAEGIEEQAQSDMLESMGCTMAQGYLFGRPAPLDR